jgi:hypothetical protein
MDQETFKKYLFMNNEDIQSRFAAYMTLPDGSFRPYGLMFDMWDDGMGHKFIAVFIVHQSRTDSTKPELFLLCFTPTLDPSTSDGDSQIETIEAALDAIHFTWATVLFIVADNTAVNPSIAGKTGRHFIGCKSHMLALFVKKSLRPYQKRKSEPVSETPKLLDKLNTLMVKLNNAHMMGLLSNEGCHLVPKHYGHKWEATFEMVKRYFQMKESIYTIAEIESEGTRPGGEELVNLLLSPGENFALRQLLDRKLARYHDVTTALQSSGDNNVTLSDARYCFNRLLEAYPDAAADLVEDVMSHLKPENVHDIHFESGLVKIQLKMEGNLNVAEAEAVKGLLKPVAAAVGPQVEVADVQDEAAQPRGMVNREVEALLQYKKSREANGSKYINTEWIPSGTCDAERFFSGCKRVFTEQRQGMVPMTFEGLMYSRTNKHWWDIQSVAKIVK